MSLMPWGGDGDVPEAPDWAGIDRTGKLVWGTEPTYNYDRHKTEYIPGMFEANALVDRILVWSTEYRRTRPLRPQGYFSVVHRDTYDRWVQTGAIPFAAEEWGRLVHHHAERHGLLTGVQLEDVKALSERWVRSILGERLTDIRFAPFNDYPDKVSMHLTVDDPYTPKKERVVEAALLGGLPVLTHGVVFVEVTNPGAPEARTIEITWGSTVQWYRYTQGDPEYLEGWLSIDGTVDEARKPASYFEPIPPYTPYDLIDLMEARPRLEALLPEGASLILGKHRLGGGVAVIEATVPADWSAEQRWAVYGDLADKFFAQGLSLEYVYVILYQGDEVEVFRMWRNSWSVRAYLAQASGLTLEPASVPLMAQWYDRYTVVAR